MNTRFPAPQQAAAPLVWQVGPLVRAVADAVSARFNPVTVRGELSGLSRAGSGHWYFTLKDDRADASEPAQLRCAMFRRAAQLVDFSPRDGDLVELRGRLDVYAPRGDFQLIAESMTRAGQGTLFEQFIKLKARLEAEGLFDAGRKRPLPAMPRGIGVVTSLQAAALHDVITALRRRVPHVPVWIAPASVQGAQAPAELARALHELGARAGQGVDVILLVRGGGSMEDLWAFNDEALARAIVASPVPVVSGVGHETDFTIADFCADLRAPTPTAAAELCCQPRDALLAALDLMQQRIARAGANRIDQLGQRHDLIAHRLARPSHDLLRQRALLDQRQASLTLALRQSVGQAQQAHTRMGALLQPAVARCVQREQLRLHSIGQRLQALNPHQVLARGYAWLVDGQGQLVSSTAQVSPGQRVSATLGDGVVDLGVLGVRPQ